MSVPIQSLPSFGDLARLIELCSGCVRVLKSAGDADSEYEESAKFLHCLHATIKRAADYIANNPETTFASDLKHNLELMVKPWSEFRDFLIPYEPYLTTGSKGPVAKTVPKAIKYAMREVLGKVLKLKEAIVLPLHSMLFLVGLQTIQDIKNIKNQPFTISQIEQIAEATSCINVFSDIQSSINAVEQQVHRQNTVGSRNEELLLGLKEAVHRLTNSFDNSLKYQSENTDGNAELLSPASVERLEKLQAQLEDLQKTLDRSGKSSSYMGFNLSDLIRLIMMLIIQITTLQAMKNTTKQTQKNSTCIVVAIESQESSSKPSCRGGESSSLEKLEEEPESAFKDGQDTDSGMEDETEEKTSRSKGYFRTSSGISWKQILVRFIRTYVVLSPTIFLMRLVRFSTWFSWFTSNVFSQEQKEQRSTTPSNLELRSIQESLCPQSEVLLNNLLPDATIVFPEYNPTSFSTLPDIVATFGRNSDWKSAEYQPSEQFYYAIRIQPIPLPGPYSRCNNTGYISINSSAIASV